MPPGCMISCVWNGIKTAVDLSLIHILHQHERETDNFSGQKITDKTNADQKKYLAAWVEERRAM